MSHCVTGIIAKPEVLDEFSTKHGLHRPLSLAQGFFLLPLLEEDIDLFIEPPPEAYLDGFNYLSTQLSACLAEASKVGPILYFETEYFGGAGAQGAAVYSGGTAILGPVSAEHGPINNGLALLGVSVSPGAQDEFESIGLDQHRHTADWV